MEPWQLQLSKGNVHAAWDLFIETYRQLILKTIRRTLSNHDDVMDAFAHVCAALSANNLARVDAYHQQSAHTAKFATWLVVVVRNQVVDWLRSQTGRPRTRIPEGLSELETRVFELVFVDRCSHVEAYERVHVGHWPDLSFSSYLKVLADVYRASGLRTHARRAYARDANPAPADTAPLADQIVAAEELSVRVRQALEILEPEDRLAVQLFVLEDVAAAEVARILGWRNPKTVYNRVYRALATLRAKLATEGITPDRA